jgi:hypothetical protein
MWLILFYYFKKNGLKYPLNLFFNFIFEKKNIFAKLQSFPPQKNTGV